MLPGSRPCKVEGVIIQNVKAPLHHVPQDLLLGQIVADDFSQVVVRRLQCADPTMLPYQDMTVAGSGVEPEGIVVKFCPDGIHQDVGICGGNLAGTVVKDGLLCIRLRLCQRDDVAAENHIVILHLNADAEGFQGRSA